MFSETAPKTLSILDSRCPNTLNNISIPSCDQITFWHGRPAAPGLCSMWLKRKLSAPQYSSSPLISSTCMVTPLSLRSW